MIVQLILTTGSVITAIGTIIACIKTIHTVSNNSIDKYINKTVQPMFEQIQDGMASINDRIQASEEKSDERVRQQLRYQCLCFASDLRKGIPKTRNEYEEIFRMEDTYNKLIEQYNIPNGFMHEEMAYVHRQYQALSSIKNPNDNH